MLLLPFTFANVAFWARPGIPAADRPERLTDPDRAAAHLVRILCVSLTATLVLAAAGVAMDLVGWQCRGACLGKVSQLGFLGRGWWATGTRPVGVALAGPVALLVVLWLLARRSFQYEAEVPTAGPAPTGEPASQMEGPLFWAGEGQVRRLAFLHLTTALVAVAAGLGLVLVGVVVSLAGRGVVQRDGSVGYGRREPAQLVAAGVLLVATAAWLLLPARQLVRAGTLPGYGATVTWLVTGQFLAVTVLAGMARSGWWGLPAPLAGAAALVAMGLGRLPGPEPGPRGRLLVALVALTVAVVPTLLLPARGAARRLLTDDDRPSRPAWGARGPAVVLGIGWAHGQHYSAGVEFLVVDWLKWGATPTGAASTIAVPVPTTWGAVGLTVSTAVVAATALATWVRRGRLARAHLAGWSATTRAPTRRSARTSGAGPATSRPGAPSTTWSSGTASPSSGGWRSGRPCWSPWGSPGR